VIDQDAAQLPPDEEALDKRHVVRTGRRDRGEPAPKQLDADRDAVQHTLVFAFREQLELSIAIVIVDEVIVILITARLRAEWRWHPPCEVIENVVEQRLGVFERRRARHGDRKRDRSPSHVFPQHWWHFPILEQTSALLRRQQQAGCPSRNDNLDRSVASRRSPEVKPR
jgi:hypothetical protein